MSYRDDALAALDVRAFWESHGIKLLSKVGADEYRYLCPIHGDTEPSANVNVRTGLWRCHACDTGGSPIDWLMKWQGLDYRAALEAIGQAAGLGAPSLTRTNGAAGHPSSAAPTSLTKTKLTESNVKAWHEAARRNGDLMSWLHEHRGYSDDTIDRFEIGWDGQRVTIPVRDEDGKLVNVRRYQRDSSGVQGKMIHLMAGSGPDVTTRLYPGLHLPDEVLLVEGEWDAIICQQEGLDARTVTIGAGNWNPSLTPLFDGKTVTILYDNDEAGRKGALKIARILANVAASVRIAVIPGLPEKGDPTDFFIEQGRSVDELRQILAEATPFIVAATVDETKVPVTKMPLARASDARYRNQRLELPILLSGKAMTPYTIPREALVTCSMNNKRLCPACPMLEANGRKEVTVSASDPAVLSLIGVSTSQQYAAMKELAQALKQCNLPKVEVTSSINIEELRLIPELDAANSEGESEYVTRTGYFLGHGLLPNRGYAMRGYAHPHPKTQATVHLLSEAEPAQDNITAFSLTADMNKRLRMFEGDPAAVFPAVYDDFAQTVHRIRDRLDMQIAYDLVWHSAIGFYFNGAFVRRGWAEAMVIGDSGQGKTEMVMELLRHYRLGERVQGETTSGAGLIGGLEKMGDTWMLSWGRVPLNDKRLLIIDETQGINSAQIESMSDVRATGVAEITKIRTERTNARCRLIWLANPISGLVLAQHNQGVLAIKELFKKPEDIRRLDFAIATASGDVDYAKAINVRHGAAADPVYDTDSCRELILWAWSRRPDQIDFTPEATDAILAAATDMGRRYHPSIPLVEPSDQRLKLARLSVATAIRVHHADPSGERVVVGPEHVSFVVDFLSRAYAARGMAYDEYSAAQLSGERLTDDAERLIRSEIVNWTNSSDAIGLLRSTQTFRKTDLIDSLGWDDAYAKSQLRFMQSQRLLKTTRTGYYKTPAFISLLRDMAVSERVDLGLEDREDEPF